MDTKLLVIYLNDHLGGSMGGIELAKRTRANNEGSEFEATLTRLVTEIQEDREILIGMIETLGGRPDPIKRAIAWTVEKVARAKPNGQLTGYSPLSRLVEFEGLMLGISGKLALWRALAAVAPEEFTGIDLPELIARAERQRDDIERSRMDAARIAFGSPGATLAA